MKRRRRSTASAAVHVVQSEQAEQLLRARYATDPPPPKPRVRPGRDPDHRRGPNVRGKHMWTVSQLDTLELMYKRGDPVATIAAYFGVTARAVEGQAHKLHIKHLSKSRTLSQRFRRYTAPDPNSECLLWTGTINAKGYGILGHVGRRTRLATHVALALAGIGLAPEVVVGHHCGNPRCVNSDHLFIGDHLENMRRRKIKERGRDECPHGHPMIGDNVVFSINGWRICRLCRNETARRLRAKRREGAAA